MSKSLKNFITIREALQEFTARQLRLLFCLQARCRLTLTLSLAIPAALLFKGCAWARLGNVQRADHHRNQTGKCRLAANDSLVGMADVGSQRSAACRHGMHQ